jgi:adenylate kinase
MPTYVVLLGSPGAGKGTQAQLISKDLDLPQISTGDLFRAMKEQDTPLARQVRAILASGELVPDDITVQMVEERLSEPDCADGAIMDGFPRTVPQAEAFDELLVGRFESQVAVAPLMTISEDEAVRRISGRRSCPTCKAVYHVEFNPPKKEGVCDKDGTALTQREDDMPDVVRQRYRVYLEQTAPLVDYYRERGVLVEIDATRPIEAITGDLLGVVRQHMQSD